MGVRRRDTGKGGEMSGWMPIETAPKDGAEFLAYMVDDDTKWTMVASFERDSLVDYHGHMAITECATHWMPLPEPPQEG